MNEESFQAYLTKGGRSESATRRCLAKVGEFQEYLQAHQGGKALGEAEAEDLEAFVQWLESEPDSSAKTHLWALGYYFQYLGDTELRHLAGLLREQRITRRPFAIRGFRGVSDEHAERLAGAGIRNVAQMLKAGQTPARRQALADRTGIPLSNILEMVKLSDLARIPGVKGVRARLYHDAGVDTVEKMATWEPEALRRMIVEFVDRTGFDGIPTLLAEARFTVKKAKDLPKIVDYGILGDREDQNGSNNQ
ncbi:MAG: DUF4332 domain-containing protein [Anaerolineae bacterium]|jgi:hypothetical protein